MATLDRHLKVTNLHPREGRRVWLGLIFWIGLCFFAAFLGSIATDVGRDSWYYNLDKPSWQPPNFVFGPVWTVLYLLMGISAWLAWRSAGKWARVPLMLFMLQLILNVAWSYLFFGAHEVRLAFIEILLLWVSIAATIAAFWRYNHTAALLLLPYIAWVTFASALTYSIMQLN